MGVFERVGAVKWLYGVNSKDSLTLFGSSRLIGKAHEVSWRTRGELGADDDPSLLSSNNCCPFESRLFSTLQWHREIDMLSVRRNSSVLVLACLPANSICITQVQRRFISRDTAIYRGLRQEASGGRTERSWENRSKPNSWERRGKQADSDPFLERRGKRWEDRGSTHTHWQEEGPGQSRSYTNKPWAEEISRPHRRESKAREHRGAKPWTQHHQDKPWEAGKQELGEKGQYPREINDQGISRSYGHHSHGASSSANDAEAAPLGFTRPAFGRNQGDGRQPQSRPMLRKEYMESRFGAESDPISIPYTTAASEFLYGYNPVRAALKAGRRQLYKIYIHPRVAGREDGGHVRSLTTLAQDAKVEVKDVDDSWLRVMDKMSDHRPHNVRLFLLVNDTVKLTCSGRRLGSLTPSSSPRRRTWSCSEEGRRRRRLSSHPWPTVQRRTSDQWRWFMASL